MRTFKQEDNGTRAAVEVDSRQLESIRAKAKAGSLIGVDEGHIDTLHVDRLVHGQDFEILVLDFQLELDEIGGAASMYRNQLGLREGQESREGLT